MGDLFQNTGLSMSGALALYFALFVALAFEFVNGFHDTANAVATVIYTKSLKPTSAVVISGVCNFLGVFLGGAGIAFAVMKLLPGDVLSNAGSSAAILMVASLLLAAIIWNLGTWYLGLPASSSHTLFGAMLGAALAHSIFTGHFGEGVSWKKAQEIGLALLVSPLFGFGLAAALLLFLRRTLSHHPKLFKAPVGDAPPPWPIRALLISTCGAVSAAHGSNDGQKGVGLILVILIGLLPAFGLNPAHTHKEIHETLRAVQMLETRATGEAAERLHAAEATLLPFAESADIPRNDRRAVREAIIAADTALDKAPLAELNRAQTKALRKSMRSMVDYTPTWVLVAVALALGIGTMIGWKRIVVTIGEKIGKNHLTYAQGAAAEVVAATTIGLSATLGLPVSTTHVLSSGVAGTMAADKTGLQKGTVRAILLAWVLTLPVAMLLSGLIYTGLRFAMLIGTPQTALAMLAY